MYSFSSASQMCEPFPRTRNGGSPPTDPKARTGEFTPPGITCSARCCKRRDCSTFRVVIVVIQCSPNLKRFHTTPANRLLYQRPQINRIFTIPPSSRNISQLSSFHLALLTGRVRMGRLRGLRAVLFHFPPAFLDFRNRHVLYFVPPP